MSYASTLPSFPSLSYRRDERNAFRVGLCVVLLLILPSFLFAQTVTIKGYAWAYKGESVSLYSYKDYITYTPQMLVSGKISDSGKFILILPNVTMDEYLYLNIENMNASIYVSPGATYHVVFPPPDSLHYQNPYVSHDVDLNFMNKKCGCPDDTNDLQYVLHHPEDINNLIIDYNNQFDAFWKKYYTYFVRKQANGILDSFRIAMQKRYAPVNNHYFNGFLDYTIAEIGISIMEGEKSLGNKYLKGKPILYHNYEYMKFVNDYFKDYLGLLAIRYVKKDDKINRFINSGDYTDLVEAMKINPYLRDNDSLCELVLLKGLYELYYNGDNDEKSIKTLIKTVATTTRNEDSRLIANDMLNSFSDVVSGATAPEFTLKDSQGDNSTLEDFRGKYTYICFFKGSSESCTGELDVIAALHKQYGKKINFVCISEDDNFDDLKKYLEDNKMFNWTFLYDDVHKVMQQYDVKSLPEFFLINPKGQFYKSPAEPPSHGIQMIFDDLLAHRIK